MAHAFPSVVEAPVNFRVFLSHKWPEMCPT